MSTGLSFNENPWQGSLIVDELTDLVEEAVYQEFERISERGGVPLIGINTFLGGK